MKKAIILFVTLSVLLLLVIGYKLVHRVEPISPIVTEETIPNETETPDVQEVTGVGEDGNISYVTSDGDSGVLEDSTSQLAKDWGVSKEEIEANERNMSEEEFMEWMMKMDEEYNQRLEEAAKKEAEAAKAETAQEVQQPQQETQAEVKQPQQTQETQEQNNDPGVTYNDDGSITLNTAAGIDVVIGGGELSVREMTPEQAEYDKGVTVN